MRNDIGPEMIPLRVLWRIDVAARKQESSTAVALVRLLGWGVAVGLWWWLGALTDEQVLLVIAGVEAVAAVLQAILPDRFGSPYTNPDVGLRQPVVDLPPRGDDPTAPATDYPPRSGWDG